MSEQNYEYRNIDISHARLTRTLAAQRASLHKQQQREEAANTAYAYDQDALQQEAAPVSARAAAGAKTAPNRPRSIPAEEYAATHSAAARQEPSASRRRASQTKTQKRRKVTVLSVLCILIVLVVSVGAGYFYVDSKISTGEMGQLSTSGDAAVEETPPEYKGKMLNILVLGIDYTAEDGQGRSPIGNTDMIMYVRMNFENNSMQMLQIPRDTLVGDNGTNFSGNTTGKLNGIFACANDPDNRVAAVANYINSALGLPIDNYVTMDMDALKEIINRFSGIDVYVPKTISYAGSTLEAGWRHLMGDECEFFLRARKDETATPRGDIDRLENQRYFYSALFRRIKTATWQDIVKLLPVVEYYINTNISTLDLAGIGVKMLSMPSENIMVCRMPTGACAYYKDLYSVVGADKNGTADLLNTYFRTGDIPITAGDIGFIDVTLTGYFDAAVTYMSGVDSQGAGETDAPTYAQQQADANAAQEAAAQQAASQTEGEAPSDVAPAA